MVTVVGLGPAGPEWTAPRAAAALASAPEVLVRTERHPAAVPLVAAGARSLDRHYETAGRIEDAYRGIVEEVVGRAGELGRVAYAVPGSPLVLEHTVELLRADGRVEVELVAGMSFLDLAWARLGVDPVSAAVRLVDAERFAEAAAGDAGPLLVCQLWSRAVCSEVKLSVEVFPDEPVVLLHHLGLADEQVVELAWEELDRSVVAVDHLTSCYVPRLAAPVAAELVRLDGLVRTLRERCPWDAEQTHASLARHLLEEAYEALEAIHGVGDLAPGGEPPAELAVDHLEEELGDVLCQVLYHARLAEEEGLFSLADVARSVHDKLVARHPHVFGDATAADAAEVLGRWERLKQQEKGRASLVEGIPAALPALARVAKLEGKLRSAGLGAAVTGLSPEAVAGELSAVLGRITPGDRSAAGAPGVAEALGRALLGLARLTASAGLDPEDALGRAGELLVGRIRATEDAVGRDGGTTLLDAEPAARRAAWEAAGRPTG